jgi:hypothetical protein
MVLGPGYLSRCSAQACGSSFLHGGAGRASRPGALPDCAYASAACSQCPPSQALNADRLRSVAAGVIWPCRVAGRHFG